MGSGTAGDSASVLGGTAALPETGGVALAQVFYALGGMMMTVGGIMLKRKIQ